MSKNIPSNNLVDLSSLSPEQMEEILAGYMASKARTADDFLA